LKSLRQEKHGTAYSSFEAAARGIGTGSGWRRTIVAGAAAIGCDDGGGGGVWARSRCGGAGVLRVMACMASSSSGRDMACCAMRITSSMSYGRAAKAAKRTLGGAVEGPRPVRTMGRFGLFSLVTR
jgi:hypothetical protein